MASKAARKERTRALTRAFRAVNFYYRRHPELPRTGKDADWYQQSATLPLASSPSSDAILSRTLSFSQAQTVSLATKRICA